VGWDTHCYRRTRVTVESERNQNFIQDLEHRIDVVLSKETEVPSAAELALLKAWYRIQDPESLPLETALDRVRHNTSKTISSTNSHSAESNRLSGRLDSLRVLLSDGGLEGMAKLRS
jgi:hypothetical protein